MDAITMRSNGSFDSNFSKKKAHQFSRFLHALSEAHEYALDLECSRWDFAINLADARAMDVQVNDLRWMIRKGWIQHASGPLANAEYDRLEIEVESHFVIGQSGIDALRNFSADPVLGGDEDTAAPLSAVIKPCWDAQRHELSVVGQVVKRYRWPASNQETILTAFEEESWPARIDDPLPRVDNLEPKRRLSDTIKCLNRNQCASLVRFRGDGTGEGILWDVQRSR